MFKEKINPYRFFINKIYRTLSKEIADKIRWDLNAESRSSLRRFKQLKDSHKGERAIMIFNGPSLLKTDFSLLKNVFTFGLNKINLIAEEKQFSPSIIIAFDELLNIQNKAFLNNSPQLLKILNYKSLKPVGVKGDNVIYLYHLRDTGFCYDPSTALINRGSTPYIAFQIAYYMGFQEIAIIGADHNFPDIVPHVTVTNEEEDKFHFHKDYHKKGEKNQYPDKIRLDLNFRTINEAFTKKGRKVYNATEDGKLEIFERINLKDFLAGKQTESLDTVIIKKNL